MAPAGVVSLRSAGLNPNHWAYLIPLGEPPLPRLLPSGTAPRARQEVSLMDGNCPSELGVLPSRVLRKSQLLNQPRFSPLFGCNSRSQFSLCSFPCHGSRFEARARRLWGRQAVLVPPPAGCVTSSRLLSLASSSSSAKLGSLWFLLMGLW